mgnify:FL=1
MYIFVLFFISSFYLMLLQVNPEQKHWHEKSSIRRLKNCPAPAQVCRVKFGKGYQKSKKELVHVDRKSVV